jgi:hypothetical protein
MSFINSISDDLSLGRHPQRKKLKEERDCEKDNRLLVACHVFGRIIDGMCNGGCTREWWSIHRP